LRQILEKERTQKEQAEFESQIAESRKKGIDFYPPSITHSHFFINRIIKVKKNDRK